MIRFAGLTRPHALRLGGLLGFLDVLAILATLWICGFVYDVDFRGYHQVAVWAVVMFLLFAGARGSYQGGRIHSFFGETVQIAWVWFWVVCSLIIFAFLSKISHQYSRIVIVAWAILTPVVLSGLRVLLHLCLKFLYQHKGGTLAFAGAGALASQLAERMCDGSFMVLGVYDDLSMDKSDLPYRGDLNQLVQAARKGEVDYVYITLPMHEEEKTLWLLNALADTTASVYIVPDLYLHNLLHARWFNVDGIPIVSVFESPFYGVDGWLKRVEDVVVGGLILLLISPLMLGIAAAIKLTSAGPVIFKQRRYGLNGEIIEVWKFRSMTVCEDSSAEIQQAKRADPRITPLGAFLRKSSLDELPQFINVLQGRMSIVGPRPHAVAHNEQYRQLIYGYMLRHKVKPGITGWAQVNGWRGETDTLDKMEKRVEYDLHYINHWTLWLDFKIILLTVTRAFFDKNAY